MANQNELRVQINADAKNAKKAFDDVRKQTEDLDATLTKVAAVSAIAFAALTTEVFSSVKAFEEAQASAVQLNVALQNQGIYTKALADEYKSYATAVQAATGIDDDAVTKSQAIAQTYLGQTKITKELTFAIADLGASMGGDLNSAAEKIARTIGTSTNAFARQGLVLDETATRAERTAKVLEFVQTKAGGLAEEFNKADGYTKALSTAFGNLQEEIGARFAPIIAKARQAIIGFFEFISNNPGLVDFAAALITAGIAVTGIVGALASGVVAFGAISAAASAAGVVLNVAFAGIPLLLGALAGSIAYLALNWNDSLLAIKSITSAVITFVSEAFSGLTKVLSGAFTLDVDKIKEGLAQVKDAYQKAGEAAEQTIVDNQVKQDEALVTQDEKKKAAAAKEAAQEAQHQANLRAIRQAEISLLKLQNENASAELIQLKQKEIETLKALDQEKSAQELALYRERLAQIKGLQEQAQAEDAERQLAFAQTQAEVKAELAQQGIEVENELRAQELAAIQEHEYSKAEVERQIQTEALNRKVAQRNQELIDIEKYGETTAAINKFTNSQAVKDAKQTADELVALTQSKNDTLKSIGKAAAISQIVIKTPEAAMNAYNSLVGIPYVGPVLAVAAAAATYAFGAERIAQVTAAADGGLITGGVPGKDSVPALLMPGELVVPAKNFDQVVGAVQNQNNGGSSDPQVLEVLNQINNKFSNPVQNIFNGDIMAEDAFVDRLINKISDRIEFGNATIFGVTS